MPVPLRPYRRIASGTLIADRVLAGPVRAGPHRRVHPLRREDTAAATATQASPRSVRATTSSSVLALKPDLLFVNDLVDASYVARLREHGVQVFDLGPMRGLDTLLPNIRAIGR